MSPTEIVTQLKSRRYTRSQIKEMISNLNSAQLLTLKYDGFNADIRFIASGRYALILRQQSIAKAVKDVCTYTMSIYAASRKHKVSASFVKDEVYKVMPDYDPKKIDRTKSKGRMLDRLHYHPWDSSLKMKRDFFNVIEEDC